MNWAVAILALALSGCTSLYQPHIQSFSLKGNDALGATTSAPTLTTFEQWTSIWSAVCGAVITYTNGEPAQVIPGNCGTPLTLFMNSPVNYGLAGLAINHP